MATASRVLVCTGCTSGLGRATLALLLSSASPPLTLIIGSRTIPPTSPLPPTSPHTIHYLPLDLASLSSTRAFAAAASALLPAASIDSIFLNAGEWKAEQVEGQGGWIEEAVVNHFSQHYLVLLLAPLISPTIGAKSRIVVTTSSLHKSVVSTQSLRSTLRPSPDAVSLPAKERYSASKFVQFVAARSWAASVPVDVDVVAVSPGFIPTTGLNRESGFLGRFFLRWILYWAPFCSTEEQGARGLLHALTTTLPATSPDSPHPDVLYLDNKGAPLEPSPLIAEGGQALVDEWSPGTEEMESWKE